ncbi:MAG: hypothetical protein ACT4O9_03250 [Blastocatellia bacterium]
MKRVLIWAVGVIAVAAFGLGIGAFVYWQSLKETPQYSLALIIDAAKKNDQDTINRLVDTDAIVDDFVPQITGKAADLYGRGLPPQVIAKLGEIATPLLPSVKIRARAEVPGIIRQKTERFADVPFAALVVGADRYLDIRPDGDSAIVRSKLPQHKFEVIMNRNGNGWQIVAVRDEQLATQIAQTIGQQVIGIASKRNSGTSVSEGQLNGIQELIKQAEDIFR